MNIIFPIDGISYGMFEQERQDKPAHPNFDHR